MTNPGLLDALPVAVYIADAEGRITCYNQDAVILKKPFRADDLFAALKLLTHRAPG